MLIYKKTLSSCKFGIHLEAGFEVTIKDSCRGFVGEGDLREVDP
jgi:hypothetical protein